MEKSKRFMLIAIFLSMMFSLSLSSFSFAFARSESFEEYTSVVTDLQQDESFNTEDFPFIQDDHSLHLIQIAESSKKEVFVYVYQPGAIANASSINISLNLHDQLSFNNYSLQLINSVGVFQKYLVQDLIVVPESVRYYEISSIFRSWNENVDEVVEGNNTISEVAYPVNKLYTFVDEGEQNFVSVVDIETIEITDKYVGFVRYDDGIPINPALGFDWAKPGYDSHFVAFNTNNPIEKLYEADVYFTSQELVIHNKHIVFIHASEELIFKEIHENYKYMKYDDHETISAPIPGLFAGGVREFEFNRIQKVDDFLNGEETEWMYSGVVLNEKTQQKISAESLENIENKQWVLRFAETPYQELRVITPFPGTYTTTEKTTLIGDVTILRLKFEADGIVYNLGVIDNKQTGDGEPINEFKTVITPSTMLKIVIALLVLILLSTLLTASKTIFEIILLPFSIFRKKE